MSPNRSKFTFLFFLMLVAVGLYWLRTRPTISQEVAGAGGAAVSPPQNPLIPTSATSSMTASQLPEASGNEPKNSGATLGPARENEAGDSVRADFQIFADRVLREFPRKMDLQKLTAAEAHETPTMIREASVRMGEIADLMSRHSRLKPEGLEFYKRCSLEQELPDSIRALCLNHAIRLHAELHHELWSFDREKISRSLIDLAKQL